MTRRPWFFGVLAGGRGRVAAASLTGFVAAQMGEVGLGEGWGNFPAGLVLPRLVPRIVITGVVRYRDVG